MFDDDAEESRSKRYLALIEHARDALLVFADSEWSEEAERTEREGHHRRH